MNKKILVTIMSLLLIVIAGCGQLTGNDSASSNAEDYPNREIDIVIPYASGGSADLQARIISDYLKDKFDETVNVVSKGGGAGSTGMNFVKGSKPDGYTIILTAVGPSTLTPNSKEVGYDVTEDFEAISQISEATYGIAVNSSSDIDTLEELFDKYKEEEITYGTTGAGLHQHVVTAALTDKLEDVNMKHVPFEGGAEAVSVLLGDHVTAGVNTISELLPHEESGDIKILAVTSPNRLDELPDVPTFKELDYELISNGAWFGLMAPEETPEAIVEKIDEAVKEALEDDGVKEKFKNAELPIEYLDNSQFKEKVIEENEVNKEIINDLDL